MAIKWLAGKIPGQRDDLFPGGTEYKSSNAGNLNILLLFLIYKMNFVIGTAY